MTGRVAKSLIGVDEAEERAAIQAEAREAAAERRRRGGTRVKVDVAPANAGSAATEPVPTAISDGASPLEVRPPEPLPPEAMYGLPGDWWRVIEPQSEAHPAAVIFTFCTLFGNAIGRRPHFDLSVAGRQHAAEYLLVTGLTNSAKGDSLTAASMPFRRADPDWWKNCRFNAANSTAGVIDLVRDPRYQNNDDTLQVIEEGCADPLKRACFTLTEFASLVKKFETNGDTLSSTYRDAWDGTPLQNTSKSNRSKATDYQVSMVAHVTPTELRGMTSETEAVNGFLNRFLWCHAIRTKDVPIPGPLAPSPQADIESRLASRIIWARQVDRVGFAPATEHLWCAIYSALRELGGGRLGPLFGRARTHVLRLSLIAALMDGKDTIEVPHLLFACAMWDYSAQSVAYIYPEGASSTVRKLIAIIEASGGSVSAGDIYDATNRKIKRADLHAAAAELIKAGILTIEKQPTAGRSRDVYALTGGGRWTPVICILPVAREAVL